MAKLTLDDINTGYLSTTQLNQNFTDIETALENTLSRDGTSPNQMESDLDMNGSDVINVGTLSADDVLIAGQSLLSLSSGAADVEANVILAQAAADSASISALDASNSADIVVNWVFRGAWVTATSYLTNNLVYDPTSRGSYIALVDHTSGTFATDYSANKWSLVASAGLSGAGTGDMLKTENLSGLANYTTARTNLGLAIGTNVQAQDALLQSLAGQTTANLKVQGYSGVDTATLYTLDATTTLGTSDTTIPTQKAVKTYSDTKNIATQVAPGTSGNVLTSNGTTWESAAPVTGSVAAFASFDGTQAVGVITSNSDSGNVTITKTATGKYTITMDPAMSDSNYAVLVSTKYNSTINGMYYIGYHVTNSSSFDIWTKAGVTGINMADLSQNSFMVVSA